jgi:serine/threonine-protein kinase HipA
MIMDKNSFKIEVCPGTLAEGYSTYSPLCLRRVFEGKKVNPILPFNPPMKDEMVEEQFIDNRKRISISGVQEKLSFILEKNILRLTHEGEQGTYILKPIPRDVRKTNMVPANEHLTMQIARQVYQIPTAENALIFFLDGTPAYITKRFDVKEDGSKWGKEDFATLAGRSRDNAGADFKYTYSYEALGLLFQKYVPAWKVEIEKYFQLVVFNYLFSNGDAHLKNFSLLESSTGDYLLSPAYDLLNTRLHVGDTPFALSKGLFEDDFKSAACRKNNHPSVADFTEFGRRIGLADKRIEKILLPFQQKNVLVEQLVKNSFLGKPEKKGYLIYYNTRMNFLLA